MKTQKIIKGSLNPYEDNALVKVGQKLGLVWTNNNETYKAIVEIVKINLETVKIRLTNVKPDNYNEGQQWNVSLYKKTEQNHLFKLNENSERDIINFNQDRKVKREYINEIANKYFEVKIETSKAERLI